VVNPVVSTWLSATARMVELYLSLLARPWTTALEEQWFCRLVPAARTVSVVTPALLLEVAAPAGLSAYLAVQGQMMKARKVAVSTLRHVVA
jgi:hypothetical protein